MSLQVTYTDYRVHYTLDARAILDPADLPPDQRESEDRRLETIARRMGLPRGAKVLDIGCGSGWLTAKLLRRGLVPVALDLALIGVQGARRRVGPGARFVVGDVYALPFAPASFDGAVMSEVAEHLEDVDRAFAEVARLLKPGGRLIVTVPNNERIRWHLCVHCNRLTPANAHVRSFTAESLRGHLERQGLTPSLILPLSNKLLELLRFPRWSRSLPYPLWRAADAFANALLPKGAFLCAVAVKGHRG